MIDLLGRRHHWHESAHRPASHLTSPRNLQVGKQWHCGRGGEVKEEEADKVEEEEKATVEAKEGGGVKNDNEEKEKEGGDVEGRR